MKTKNIRNLIAILSLAVITVSCDQDETVPRAPKAIVELEEETVTVSESGTDDPDLTFRQDIPTIPQVDDQYTSWWGAPYPTERGVEMRVEIVGGTATEGVDYEWAVTAPFGSTVEDVGFEYWGGNGLYYWLPPDATALENIMKLSSMIVITNDGVTEGDETIELRFYPVGMGLATIDDTLTITITD